MATVALSLLDPAVDRRRTPLELSGKAFNTTAGLRQRDDVLPESRRLRAPCSRHPNILFEKSKSVHQTGGIPVLVS